MPVLNFSLLGDPLVCFGWGRAMRWLSACHHLSALGETSKLIGCSLHIQQPAAANLYRKCYTLLLNAAAFWLQPAVINFDVFPNMVVFSAGGAVPVSVCVLPLLLPLLHLPLPSAPAVSCPPLAGIGGGWWYRHGARVGALTCLVLPIRL